MRGRDPRRLQQWKHGQRRQVRDVTSEVTETRPLKEGGAGCVVLRPVKATGRRVTDLAVRLVLDDGQAVHVRPQAALEDG